MNTQKEWGGCGSAEMLDARFALKGTKKAYAPDRTYTTKHIRLEIGVDIAKETIDGRCTARLRALTDGSNPMVFDAVHFKILGVRWDGSPARHHYRDHQLTVYPRRAMKTGQESTVEIRYRVVRPKLGMYFIKPDRHYPNRPVQVWTQGEDEYARYWFPCHDAPHDRITSEVIASVPRGFLAVSNGRLVKRSTRGGSTKDVFHWRQDVPHATYLVTLAVGRFSVVKDRWRKKPVLYYCEKGREADARRAFGKTPKMLEFFSKAIGVDYPYPQYAQVAVADFIYGGMENTSATTQTDTALLDARAAVDYSSDELVAHELAHQWFGDYLTCKHWSHAWLNESFATYFDALFKRHDKGEDEYLYQMRANMEEYLNEDKDRYRRPIMTTAFRRPTDLFDRHLYEKGSVVLYMLHHLLGETLFWRSINTYVRTHAAGVVETDDLINAIETATGRNPRRFFDQWIYGAGHPEYRIRAWWDARKKAVNVRVVQTHATSPETGLFSVEAEFAFLTKSGEKRVKATIDQKSHFFVFPLREEPRAVLFDPDHRLLKKADFPKRESWWRVQLEEAANPLARIEAAHALASTAGPRAVAALQSALHQDAFWGVRAEAAKALGKCRGENAWTALVGALDVIDHPKIRRAIYASLRGLGGQSVANEIDKRWRSEESYFAEGEAIRTLASLRHPRLTRILEEELGKISWNDILRIAAVEAMAASRSSEWVPRLMEFTRPGHHQRLRMAAIRSLTALGPGREDIQHLFVTLTGDPFLLVRLAAVNGLKQIGDERVLPALRKLTDGDLDGRLKRFSEEAIEKIGKGIDEPPAR